MGLSFAAGLGLSSRANASELAQKNLEEIIVVTARSEALSFDTLLGGVFFLEEIQSDVAQHCKVFRGMIFTTAALVFSKGDIEDPMQGVFNPQ